MKLQWTIKTSFQDYVSASGGTVTVTPPATQTAQSFEFPGTGDTQQWSFSGAVQFVAHGGFLDVVLANPTIDWSGEAGSLTVAKRLDGSGPRHEIARLTDMRRRDDGAVTADARLSVLGAQLFGDVYSAGSQLDSIVVTGTGDA